MKRYFTRALLFIGLLLLLPSLNLANTPSLSWRFNNPRIIDSKLVFDIQVKSDLDSYYDHGFARVFFNNDAFDKDDISFSRAGMASHQVNGSNVYSIDFTITVFQEVWVINAGLASEYLEYNYDEYFELVSGEWYTYMSVHAAITNPNALAGISFAEVSMNPQNYFHNGEEGNQPYAIPFSFYNNATDLYLGRIYSNAGDWTQFGGAVDWSEAVNTSIWDGSATLEEGDEAFTNDLRLHTFDDAVNGEILAGLYIAPNAALTVQGELDANNNTGKNNHSRAKDEAMVIAKWDFEDEDKDDFPYTADAGIVENIDDAEFDVEGGQTHSFQDDLGYDGSRAPRGRRWAYEPEEDDYSWWQVKFSSIGYSGLAISAKHLTNGIEYYRTQYSLDGLTYMDIDGGVINPDASGEWFYQENLALPFSVNNQSNVYIRWFVWHPTDEEFYSGNPYDYIDDIIITGEPLPTYSGIHIASNETGKGSLIHSTPGIEGTFERYFPGSSLDWHLLSAPVSDMAIAGSDFEPRHEAGDDEDVYDTFFMWHESGWWLNYKANRFELANDGDDFFPGRGYLVAYDFTETNKNNETNPVKLFTGNLNAGNIDFPLAYGSDDPDFPDEDKHVFHKNWVYEKGWNMLGNPYPSGIDWFEADKTIFEDNYAYVYITGYDESPDGVTEGYKPIDGEVENALIAAHQGFFVLVEDPEAKNRSKDELEFTFTDAMRVHGGVFRKDRPGEFDRLVIRLADTGNYYDDATISLRPDSDFGRDRSDARKLFGYNTNVPQLYTLTADNVSVAINSIPKISEDHRIPMGMYLPSAGHYVLRITEATGQFSDAVVYLKDLHTNTEVLLSDIDGYKFLADDAENSGNFRFVLSFPKHDDDASFDSACKARSDATMRFIVSFAPIDDEPTGMDDETGQDAARIWNHKQTLYVYSPENDARVEIYNMSGSKLESHPLALGKQSFRLNLSPGIYVARLIGNKIMSSEKIVIQ